MECSLCLTPLAADSGQEIPNPNVRNLLENRLNSAFQVSIPEDGKVCEKCFASCKELCGLCAELSKIEDSIQIVIELLKSRLTECQASQTRKSRRTRTSKTRTSSRAIAVTKSFSKKQDAITSSVQVKEEDDEPNDNWIELTEFCDMEPPATSATDDHGSLDISEDFFIKKEPDCEADESNSATVLDDTTEFILGQLASDSESESSSDSKRKSTKRESSSDSRKTTKRRKKSKKISKKRINRKPLKECELCDPQRTFQSKTSLSLHYEMDHQDTERVFLCENFGCDAKLLTFELLAIHLESHRQFKGRCATETPMLHRSCCNICTQSSNFPADLRNHELEKHSEKMNYSCEFCEAKYSKQDIRDAHQLSHSEGTNQMECSLCPNQWKTRFQDRPSLDSHLIRIHNFYRTSPNRNASQISTDQRDQTEDTNHLTCVDCGVMFPKNRKSVFYRHKCSLPVSCELCNHSCKQKELLVLHVAKMHEGSGNESQLNSSLKCTTCQKLFATSFMYKRHVNCHNLETKFPFYCSLCEIRFPTDTLLSDHNNLHHSKEKTTPKLILCETCDKRFLSTFNLRKHEREDHPQIFTYKCTKCDVTLSKPEFLEIHLKTHEIVGPFKCPLSPLCPKRSYASGNSLEVHLKEIHTVGVSTTCSECSTEFSTKDELSVHFNKQHGKPLLLGCSMCTKSFTKLIYLKRHMRLAHANKETKELSRVQCQVCQKWFTSQNNLRKHKQTIHEKSTVQVCDVCGKSFSGAQYLKYHMRSHTQERNFVCESCGRRFGFKATLEMHKRTHTKQRPFVCYICNTAFTQTGPLKRHMESHKRNGSWVPKPNDAVLQKEDSSNSMQD